MTQYLILLCCILFSQSALTQKKWMGNNPGGWENSLNWQPVGVPAIADDVIFDNTFQGNSYIITMPEFVVSIHSLTISPSYGNHIELLLPVTNKNSPALIVGENGNAIVIRQGGVFRNSSGLNSGQSIQVNGSICIYDQGSYIHNTRSSHATDVVAKLSTVPGTAKGIFEFDVPGGSYPISLSNRTFGTLILSAAASGGVQTYNASGANPVTINGDFQINNGVQFNADLTRDMIIHGDYNQQGGIFNVASQANNNIIKIKGNINQVASGMITETAGGLPVIELSGSELQRVSVSGSISNSVAFSVNNPSGISLINPLVLSFKLVLDNGIVKTSGTNIITISDSCSVSGGSHRSYVDGPMRKIGNSDFEFPIGKQGDYAPLKITRTAGAEVDEFVAEYFLANPQTVYGSNFENPPMVRVSTLEYWSLKRLAGSSLCRLTLTVGTYSQATALDKLVAARWDTASSTWKSEGNEGYAGIATGTITSKVPGGFGAFTLGSIVAFQNPLPIEKILFNAKRNREDIELSWSIENNQDFDHFEIEQSCDGKKYAMVEELDRKVNIFQYQWKYRDLQAVYFRLKIVAKNGDFYYSEVIALPAYEPQGKIVRMFPVPVRNHATVAISGKHGEMLQLVISDIYGRKVKTLKWPLIAGKNEMDLSLDDLPPGVYFIRVFDRKGKAGEVRFVKL